MSVCWWIHSWGMWGAGCHTQSFLGKEIGFVFRDETELMHRGAVQALGVSSQHGQAPLLAGTAETGASSQRPRTEASEYQGGRALRAAWLSPVDQHLRNECPSKAFPKHWFSRPR